MSVSRYNLHMALVGTYVFAFSLVGLALLFVLRLWEHKRGMRLLPELRNWADAQAIALKGKLINIAHFVENLPKYIGILIRVIVHTSIVGFARIAGTAERAAHNIADLVSYKHTFERRETNSDFLKQVREHKEEINGAAPAARPVVEQVSAPKKTARKKVARKRSAKKVGKKSEKV